jgi:hypothetical protein
VPASASLSHSETATFPTRRGESAFGTQGQIVSSSQDSVIAMRQPKPVRKANHALGLLLSECRTQLALNIYLANDCPTEAFPTGSTDTPQMIGFSESYFLCPFDFANKDDVGQLRRRPIGDL